LKRPVIKSLLLRGIDETKAEAFLRAPLDLLTDPFRIPGMNKAIGRIWRAIDNDEKIVVHGDYDTDGVTSAVLLEWVLKTFGANVEIFVSNRMEDGYGPTPLTVDKIHAIDGRVIISADCGITSFDACDRASELGIDLIVTDHHNPGRKLPDAFTIVNPRLEQELMDLHGLAGVGVVFKLCHAFVKSSLSRGEKKEIDIREGLDLVAMGTVADVSPMIGENRSLVKNGMKLVSLKRRPGLKALSDVSYIEGRITTNDISRRLAPKINAAGRVGDPMVSVELLRATDEKYASKQAMTLEKFNRQRRQTERKAYKEALEMAREELGKDNRGGIVIAGDEWHPGVIGLLATKVSKHFGRPVIVLSNDKVSGELLGSGRSCAQLDILSVLNGCQHLLSSHGGHPMAVGVSLPHENLNEFRRIFIEAFFGSDFAQQEKDEKLFADDEMMFCEIDAEFMGQVESMEPFGTGNSEPVYYFRRAKVCNVLPLGDGHCRGTLEDDSGIQMPFVCYSISDVAFYKGYISILASPRRVTIKGFTEVQLFIVDVKSYEIT
ncbi:MAG: single-stranded-DNA-specific exonuclease RecJ, partial [Lentisphaeraceae bacterium]|nr:single-stranded-DNA-specific exonuclease RecJ [Lentisphaeraceae bacterium]